MKLKSSASVFFLTLFIFSFLFSAVSSAETKPSPWTTEKPYMDKISHKAGFGILNMGTGWMAIIFEPYHEGWKGIGTGLLYSLTNTAGGMLHVATFPFPVDLPLPKGGISYEYEDR